MTDQQTSRTGALSVRTNSATPAIKPDFIEVEISGEVSVVVETYDLLGMIDRADPDAMRAYLRERSDYLDSPRRAADRPPCHCDSIPEADSAEDEREQQIAEARKAGRQIGEAVRAFGDAYGEAMNR